MSKTNSEIVNDRLILLTSLSGKKIAVDARSIVMVEETMNGTRIYVVNMTDAGITKDVKESLASVVNAMTLLEQGMDTIEPEVDTDLRA